MSTNLFIRRAVRCALLSGAAAALAGALPAQAQQEDSTIQEVVVTGSRIPQPNLTSVSPVTAVGSDQVKIEGVTRVEDLINNLPQAFADFGGNLSNGSTGTATRQSAQPRLATHAGAGQQPPPDARRSDAERGGLARPEPDSGGADRARRSADGRRVGRVRRRRRRRRRQLHHERQVRRRAGRCAVQHVPAQQRRRHDRATSCATAASRCRTATCATATPRTSRSSPASTRRMGAAMPPSTSAIARSIRSRRTGATSARARSAPPTRAIRPPTRSAAAAPARRRAALFQTYNPADPFDFNADRRLHRRRGRRDARLRRRDLYQLRAVELLPARRTSARRPACSRTTT